MFVFLSLNTVFSNPAAGFCLKLRAFLPLPAGMGIYTSRGVFEDCMVFGQKTSIYKIQCSAKSARKRPISDLCRYQCPAGEGRGEGEHYRKPMVTTYLKQL
jgi:hypothetical protein